MERTKNMIREKEQPTICLEILITLFLPKGNGGFDQFMLSFYSILLMLRIQRNI